jgi:1-acyl-sn-glycerol-3-phosphate acyltransferase
VFDPVESLTQINLDDLVGALGARGDPRLGRVVRLLFRHQAQRFARQVLKFDSAVGKDGVAAAARAAALVYLRDIRVYGAENVPRGSFVAVSNHPGLTDTLVLFAAIGRPDLKTIAHPRPFLLALPTVARSLFFLPDSISGRSAVIRQVGAHLRGGGSLLTFPAATTELDPNLYPEATDSVDGWKQSAGMFLRLAPGASVLPVAVSGVLWSAPARSPLQFLGKTSSDRQLLLAALQLVTQLTLGIRVGKARVRIGTPIESPSLDRRGVDAVHESVIDQMRRLLRSSAAGTGTAAP